MTGAAASLSLPTRIGRYELLVPIGAGGMATVYLARSEGPSGFARTVAIKVMHAHLRADDPELDSDFTRALLDEAKLAALIHHPNVVTVIDAGDDALGAYLVMDYVEGVTLSALARRLERAGEHLPLGVALRVMDDVLAGLHAAHELKDDRGVPLDMVHRDVSPQNVLVGVDGVARLLDFGIAKARGRDARTRTGVLKGKVRYMAPEQLRAEPIDRRCDVWAAGVVLWELVAGRRMHASDDDEMAIAMRIVEKGAPALSSVQPDAPRAIVDVLARALAPARDDRWPTAAELRRALESAASEVGELATATVVGDLVHRIFGDALRERAARAAETRDAPRDVSVPVPAPAKRARKLALAAAGITTLALVGVAQRSVAVRPLPSPSASASASEVTSPSPSAAALPPLALPSASAKTSPPDASIERASKAPPGRRKALPPLIKNPYRN